MTSTSTSKIARRICNRAELARKLRITTRHVANLEARGMPVLRRDARAPMYDVDACWRWYMNFKVARSERRPGPLSESEARARLLHAQANLRELQALQRRGDLVEMDELARRVEHIALQLRGALLAVPGQWALAVVNVKTVREARTLLEQALHEAVAVLDNP